jgi:hypothetical protein
MSALAAGAAAVASPPRSGKQPQPHNDAGSPCAFEMSSDEEEYVFLLSSSDYLLSCFHSIFISFRSIFIPSGV